MKKLENNNINNTILQENIIQATWFVKSYFLLPSSYINLVIENNKSGILDENSTGVQRLLNCFENIFYTYLKGNIVHF